MEEKRVDNDPLFLYTSVSVSYGNASSARSAGLFSTPDTFCLGFELQRMNGEGMIGAQVMEQRKATREQIGRIVGLLVSGAIPFVEAQQLIERKAKTSEPVLDEHVFFNKILSAFPEHGNAVIDVIRPYFSWKPELQPACHGLEFKAPKAVFWNAAPYVKIFRETDLDRQGINGGVFDDLSYTLWNKIATRYLGVGYDDLRSLLCEVITFPLQKHFNAYQQTVSQKLIRMSTAGILFNAAVCIVANQLDVLDQFKPLHELWACGNYPVGFSHAHRELIVLVAD